MKTSKQFFILFLVTILISCSSNETTNNFVLENDLLGEWNINSMHTDQGTATIYANGVALYGTFSANGSSINMTTSFNENPNTVSSQGSLTANANVSFLGENYNDEIDLSTAAGFIPSGTWSLADNVLTFSSQNQNMLTDIISFDADTLKLKSVFNRNLKDLIDTDISLEIDSLSNNMISIDSIRVTSEFYLTLVR